MWHEKNKIKLIKKSTWINGCMIKSHTPLQCFPLLHFSPLLSIAVHLSRSHKAEWRHHPPHACAHALRITRTHTDAHTHTSSPSVCAAARVSGTGSSWEQESERESVSWPWSPESHFLSSFSCCAVVYQMVSRHHAVRWWALPCYRNTYTWCHLENNQILPRWNLMSERDGGYVLGVFSDFTLQLWELISAQFINYGVHISSQMLKPTTPQEEK